MLDKKDRHAELLEHLRRHDMNKERFEELAEARIVATDLGAYDCIVVPITNCGRLCPFMERQVPASLPIPTLALEAAGLRRFGKRYVFVSVCAEDSVITDEALYTALSGALIEASTERVESIAVPAFGVMAEFIAPMEAAVRSFEDLTDVIGIHMPKVVFVVDRGQPGE